MMYSVKGYSILIDDDKLDAIKAMDIRIYKINDGKYLVQVVEQGKFKSFGKRLFNLPDNKVLLHKTGNDLDFRSESVAIVDRKELGHLCKKSELKSSKYKRVYKLEATNRWISKVEKKGSKTYYRSFESEYDAAIASDYWAYQYYGESAELNFPMLSTDQLTQAYQELIKRLGETHSKQRAICHQGIKKGKDKYVGVSEDKGRRKKFRAAITVDGESIHLGRFYRKRDAARAYNKAARYYYGKNAKINNVK